MDLRVHTLRASVLADVLVVCTLILTGISVFILLWENDLSFTSGMYAREQQRANLTSGFVRYCRDSMLMQQLEADSSILLFAERGDSRVRYQCRPWGLYECVSWETGDRRMRRMALAGKGFESHRKAVLYIPDHGRAISVSGRTDLEGILYLPGNGLAYTQVHAEFFEGTPVKQEQLCTSQEEFPPPDHEYEKRIDDLFAERDFYHPFMEREERCSFREPLRQLNVPATLTGVTLRGQLVLYAANDVFVSADAHLQDVILIARKVEIAEGFRGCMQVFASDTIVVGAHVSLQQGSGLWAGMSCRQPFIGLGEGAEMQGYVIVNRAEAGEPGDNLQYVQAEDVMVKGLVFVDGNAEIHGRIYGSLYLRRPCYFAREGYYTDLLYRLSLGPDCGAVFPFCMTGPYERKGVKWLD